MERLRGYTTYILWLLILSFGVLWMLADTKVFDSMMRGPRSAGEVNGEEISLEEYQQRLNYYIQQYNRQNDGQLSAERRAYFEEQAWNELVATKIMMDKMQQMGIKVTNAELVQMITGENPDPLIKRQFQREDGTINRAALRQAIESEQNTQRWIMIEDQLREKRRQEKMSTYIQAALEVSNFELQEAYTAENSFADFSYIRYPYADVTEDQVEVSESDLRSYYNNNQERFKRKKSYSFEYVSYDKTPTKQDTMRTIKELRGLRTEFSDAREDSVFLARYQTDASYQPATVQKSELREEFQPVLDVEEGAVTDVIKADDQYHILKKLNDTGDEVRFIRLTYNVDADPIATVEEAHESADDFSYFAEQSDFTSEAEKRNKQIRSASATKGNNFVPGIGQSNQIMQFLDGADEAELSRPIELDNQFVVIKVTDVKEAGTRPFSEVKEQIRTQVTTNKRKAVAMNRLQELASAHDSLQSIAEASQLSVQTAEQVRMSSATIPGAGREPIVIGAVFGLEEGKVSSPIEGNSAAFIVQLKNKEMANPDQLTSSQRQQFAQTLQRQKSQMFMDVWMEELKEKAEIVDYRDQVFQQ